MRLGHRELKCRVRKQQKPYVEEGDENTYLFLFLLIFKIGRQWRLYDSICYRQKCRLISCTERTPVNRSPQKHAPRFLHGYQLFIRLLETTCKSRKGRWGKYDYTRYMLLSVTWYFSDRYREINLVKGCIVRPSALTAGSTCNTEESVENKKQTKRGKS